MVRRLSKEAQLHADWIAMLQPDGLVVSIPVLEEAGVYHRHGLEVQAEFRAFTEGDVLPGLDPLLDWLEWPSELLDRKHPWLQHDVPALDATVIADGLLHTPRGEPLVVVSWCPGDMDDEARGGRWSASDQDLFERLLVDKGHPVGLHVSPTQIRLVYAPAGEAPGRMTFPVEALRSADGRDLIDALRMLVGRSALLTGPPAKRLRPLLEQSRNRQERVTVALAGQVEEALRILLAGFDAADHRVGDTLLREVTEEELYDGLTTVLLRLVFLLYAEDRELLPTEHPLYAEHYSLGALAERLAAERVLYAGAMDRRFGAWARLCTLFRLVFRGAVHGDLSLPARRGDLFDPSRHPFLEGRLTTAWGQDAVTTLPRVDDEVIGEVLDRLLYLEGQRISYRNLEVEQIGSVYEALMGFEIGRATGPSVHLSPDGGVIDLEALRDRPRRVEAVAEAAGTKPARVRTRVPELDAFAPGEDQAKDVARLREILAPLVMRHQPDVARGQHYLQPGEQRRRSASHYTPRTLTRPIVERTLAPLLEGPEPPTSEQILGLRICDPAMGSGAFLAEAARFLGAHLVEAWAREGRTPPQVAAPETVARRMVVERCLYGVDKDPRAVQLARMSMWLITSARDLPFTFVDHALKEGDALIGLTLEQAAAFAFHGEGAAPLWTKRMKASFRAAMAEREEITKPQQYLPLEGREGADGRTFSKKRSHLDNADHSVARERRIADLVVACEWAGGRRSEIDQRLARMGDLARLWYKGREADLPEEAQRLVDALPLRPFHWPFEFPEVFGHTPAGFHAVIGNPPFGGKNSITAVHGASAIKVLQTRWPHAHGASDYAAYFFLHAHDLLRKGGTFGLVATNTIAQGNTRDTGLRHLLDQGVTLFDATVDMKWPVGGAAVVVSVVHGRRGEWSGAVFRDGERVPMLASDLSAGEELPEPVKLAANKNQAFIGSYVLGMGFVLTPEEAATLIERDPRNAEIIRPYIGGRELNSNVPDPETGFIPHDRYVIAFGDRTLEEAEAWPELLAIVREKVKPERDKNNRENYRKLWWQFGERRPGLYRAIAPLERCLVCSLVSKHLIIGIQPADRIFSHKLAVFSYDDSYYFGVLQSCVHDPWAWSQSSTMKTDLNYTPSRCFETFPFPRPSDELRHTVTRAGQALNDLRTQIMVRDQQGMTQVWNRVVDPDCLDPEIVELRACRAAMDRAVLDAYGWTDLEPTDRDEILARLRKLNAQYAREEQTRG